MNKVDMALHQQQFLLWSKLYVLSLTLPCISPTASSGSAELVEVSIRSRPVSSRALTDREMTISPPDTDSGAGSSHSVVVVGS